METKIPPPIQTAITALLMWVVAGLTPAASVMLPGKLLWVILFGAAGFMVTLIAFVQFRRQQTTVNPLRPEQASRLVADGIFRLSRNPMYLGMALVLLAWACWLQNLCALGVIALFVAYITHYQIKPEERALSKLFGEDFQRYTGEVRRWI